MNNEFKFTLSQKILFLISYVLYKFATLFEVKKPRFAVFADEIYYALSKVFKFLAKRKLPFSLEMLQTRFGTFQIRPETYDVIWASPAFERRDVNYLLKLLATLVRQEKKILFLDVGADFGAYTITVGNAFKSYKNLHIHAFEPSGPSFALLKKNIEINGLSTTVSSHNYGLYDQTMSVDLFIDTEDSGSNSIKQSRSSHSGATESIQVRKFDESGVSPIGYDVIVIKIDVEGVESHVLAGAESIIGSSALKYVMVEDFVNSDIVSYLEKVHARFLTKLTSYNSWWCLV